MEYVFTKHDKMPHNFTKNEKKTPFYIISLSKMVTNPLACFATAIVKRTIIYLLFIDVSCFARDVWRYIVTSRKQHFKRLYSVNG
jgi:hypothetical protein